jgi:hypothetical protein
MPTFYPENYETRFTAKYTKGAEGIYSKTISLTCKANDKLAKTLAQHLQEHDVINMIGELEDDNTFTIESFEWMSRHSQRYNWIDLIPNTPRPTLPTKEHHKFPPASKYGRAIILHRCHKCGEVHKVTDPRLRKFSHPSFIHYLVCKYYYKLRCVLRRVYKRLMPER